MQSKTMYGVEHAYDDGRETFEIFPTLKAAKAFALDSSIWSEENLPLNIFKAEFNSDFIYEEDGFWNYEDSSNLIIGSPEMVEEFNNDPFITSL